ncbi:MAG: aromatic amino acid transport family protein, partial [bacterium]|nr:aromatic amino acid transport family protein [bacterium]
MTPSLRAVLLMVGTIVGVGMFAIPFVFVRAGFLTGVLELAVLAAVVTLVHLAYAEVVLRTPEIHRLPGYAARYLGRGAAWVARFSYLFGISGTLLVYLVLGGAFLGTLLAAALPSASPAFGPVVFYLIGAFVVLWGIRFESFANAILTLGLIAALLLLGAVLLPRADYSLLQGFDFSNTAIPYGVLLFSLAGAAIIPDVRRVLGGGGPRRMAAVVAIGTLASAVLYLIFAAAVAGTTGDATTPDAIGGIQERFGSVVGLFGSAIGFLATITSFIALAVVLEGTFTSDFGVKPAIATSLTVAIPPLLFAA